MDNIDFLEKTLSYNEFTAAKELYYKIMERGISHEKAVALIFRSGVLFGKTAEKERQRIRRNAYKERLNQSQLTANNEEETPNE